MSGMRTLYRGGAVHSPSEPFATALLVDGDTVGWIGSDEAAAAQAASADHVVDLDGALVTPAFVDAHVHVTETGLALEGLDLRAARSVREILTAVENATRAGRGRPVLGHGWDERALAEGRPPTRAELDRAGAGGVVQLSRVDGHSSVVSTALAVAAGASRRQGWTDDGRVEREAHHAVRAATRENLSRGARRHLQRVALRAAAAAGIGCVQEMSAPHIAPESDLAALAAQAGPGGEEPLPEVVCYRGQLVADEAEASAVVSGLLDLGVPELAGLAGDLNADGAVGSRTAAFRSPYADAPDDRGHLYLTAEQVRDHVVACTTTGLQAGFHVIGDAGLDVVLEGFRRAAERIGIAAVRAACHRVEHVETPDDEAVARLAELGLTASVQPAFDAAWGGPDGMYAARLGAERAVRMNPFAALAAAGVPLAFGSDSPVTPFAPWEAIRAAVHHTHTRQRISAEAAFAASTRGAWRAARRPGEGVLGVGAPATLAVWATEQLVVQAPDDHVQAPSTHPPSGTPGLPDLRPGVAAPRCLRTVVRGRVVHDALT
jgi:predicted amidohydrolase YtcJ